MPLNIDLVQILLHMLNLVILVGALALILYKPVAKFLRERTERFAAREKETADKAAAWREMGANRISMGVQSFNDNHLRWMRRRHTAAGAVAAFGASSFQMKVVIRKATPAAMSSSMQ